MIEYARFIKINISLKPPDSIGYFPVKHASCVLKGQISSFLQMFNHTVYRRADVALLKKTRANFAFFRVKSAVTGKRIGKLRLRKRGKYRQKA